MIVGISNTIVQKAAAESPANQVFLARQPIFDTDLKVVAYELLYRNAGIGPAVIDDATFATAKLITNSFLEVGIENISNGKKVFINLPRPYITGEMPMVVNPDLVVLEILEDVFADPEAMEGVKKLVARGYTIALDDFVQSDANRDFIPMASIIKIDILNMTDDALRQQVASFSMFKGQLLAEKVETQEQYHLCKNLGFELFQGYFFCMPKILESRQLPASEMAMLTVISKLQDPNCEIHDIERIFINDIGLSYRLLRIVNSSRYNTGRKIESIQHALVLLGLNALKNWITLITLTGSDTQPQELINAALIRAKTCEHIAGKMGYRPEIAFTIGMFSLLDAIMSQSLEHLLENLPFVSEVKLALLKREGNLGELLVAVTRYETGDWDSIEKKFLNEGDMLNGYREAIAWCGKISDELYPKA
jgi:EAL and modified HD-GYP domain-containing signal transduction protein